MLSQVRNPWPPHTLIIDNLALEPFPLKFWYYRDHCQICYYHFILVFTALIQPLMPLNVLYVLVCWHLTTVLKPSSVKFLFFSLSWHELTFWGVNYANDKILRCSYLWRSGRNLKQALYEQFIKLRECGEDSVEHVFEQMSPRDIHYKTTKIFFHAQCQRQWM